MNDDHPGFGRALGVKRRTSGYESEQIDRLRRLQASLKMTCILTRGFSINLRTPSFYEHHSFLNLTGAWLHEADYNVGEVVRTLHGEAVYSLDEVEHLSVVPDVDKCITDPVEIYGWLLPNYERMADLTSEIFKTAAPNGDASTIALATGVAAKLKHFAWEMGVMAGKH